MKKIVLFKSVSEDYRKVCNDNNFDAIFVEPLEFVFTNLQGLCEKLKQTDYDGIILTSPRAIEAISKCWSPSKFNIWNSKKVYTVGEASCRKIKHMLGLDSLGMDTGNAENLAKLITSENSSPCKFLFPCGNLRSEILPNMFRASAMELDPLTVYETKENDNLRESLLDLNKNVNACCMVFFSPSGCEYIYRQLQTFNNKLSNLPHFAIGNSTAHKIENLGVEIAGVAAKPKPDSLIEAVRDYFTLLEHS